MTFQPGEKSIVDGQYNLWRGWGVEPKPGDWRLLRAHIFAVMCAGHKAFYKYTLLFWGHRRRSRMANLAKTF